MQPGGGVPFFVILYYKKVRGVFYVRGGGCSPVCRKRSPYPILPGMPGLRCQNILVGLFPGFLFLLLFFRRLYGTAFRAVVHAHCTPQSHSIGQDLCTRCGICSVVCPWGIISPADENTLPRVLKEREGACLLCGHCEAFCPGQALLLNYLPDEKERIPAGAGTLDPATLGTYMKLRRSVRHFTHELVPKEIILSVLDIARYAASVGEPAVGRVAGGV